MDRSSGPIIVPIDGSVLAAQALPLARYLAERLRRRILLVYTLASAGDYSALAIGHAWSAVQQLALQTIDAGVSCAGTVVAGDPGAALLEQVEDSGASCIVLIGRCDGEPGLATLGPSEERLLQRAPVPILIQAPGPSATLDVFDVRESVVPFPRSRVAATALLTVVPPARVPRQGLRLVRAPEPATAVTFSHAPSRLIQLTVEASIAYLRPEAA